MFWELNELLLFLVLVALYWAATEVGFRLGIRRHATCNDADRSHASSLQSALLGLLALLLGFSFAMAVARYDGRKALVLQEANAIGTTYLRAGFLAPDQAEQARKLLRDYVDSRLLFVAAKEDMLNVDQAFATASALQEHLWAIANAAVAQDARSVPAGLFVQTLNEVIDVSEARRAAFTNHVPGAVLALLVAVSCGAMGFIGFVCGLDGRRGQLSTATFTVLTALVLVIILDMDRPRHGLITVDQGNMLRLKASLAGDASGPPGVSSATP
jgi:hypothetical protein